MYLDKVIHASLKALQGTAKAARCALMATSRAGAALSKKVLAADISCAHTSEVGILHDTGIRLPSKMVRWIPSGALASLICQGVIPLGQGAPLSGVIF